ncbi:MAG: helix-hairpin-helix domain-containing protein [Lawsonibacter sp.]
MDFSQADALALELGVGQEAPLRLEAGLLFEMAHNLNNGHTFLPRRASWWRPPGALVGARTSCWRSAWIPWSAGERWSWSESPDRTGGLPAQPSTRRRFIAQRMGEMSQPSCCRPTTWTSSSNASSAEQGITYAPQQRQAVELAAGAAGDAPHRRAGYGQDHLPAGRAGPV